MRLKFVKSGDVYLDVLSREWRIIAFPKPGIATVHVGQRTFDIGTQIFSGMRFAYSVTRGREKHTKRG